MNVAIIIPFWSNLHLRVESDALIFLLYVLCDWFRKLMLLSQPIRCKIKPNHDLVTHVFPRFWKMENVLFFVKRQFVVSSRDWIETYSSFDWIAQRKVNRDTRLSYFPWNAKLQFAAFLWDWIVKLLHLWNVKRQVSSTFCEVRSVNSSHSHGNHLINLLASLPLCINAVEICNLHTD